MQPVSSEHLDDFALTVGFAGTRPVDGLLRCRGATPADRSRDGSATADLTLRACDAVASVAHQALVDDDFHDLGDGLGAPPVTLQLTRQ
jgi:hypothetical protein